ncbi:MAG: class I SAM-dependent methyltransferase [Natronospirillum sp.]|uniref:class I SAM-dependent methyltransferase n=1 Tax=Natronospirillum sp. TaxID=2812955 RepID=UPI0025E9A88B|nr:class I SAM-dependent methyltransferase [Natronospirillum sp.]MCH8552515.1 class I SAM-dependent methyltransferase [Natronospirillum sp.]
MSLDSKEFGLVFAQQLTGLEDLHYGYWDDSVPDTSVVYMKQAQQRYTDQLIDTLEHHGKPSMRVLDVGCGTGAVLEALSERGHQVDGVIPAPHLEKQVRGRVHRRGLDSQVWGCTMEALPVSSIERRYDAVLFSESFQYIPYSVALDHAWELLKPGGVVLICDFFKTEHSGDGKPGDRSFGGGHKYHGFLDWLGTSEWRCVQNDDITAYTSPNIRLLDELLTQRLAPAASTLNTFLSSRHPWMLALFKRLFRKKLRKLEYKYLSGHRSQAVFERYKTYRRLVLIKPE